MSASSQPSTSLSSANFSVIFNAALNEYKNRTGQDPQNHPFAVAFEMNNSPDAILEIFRRQAQALDIVRQQHERLMAYLSPIVNILFTFSATLGGGIGLVSPHPFYITILQHIFRRPSHQRRQSLLASAFFSG
jgi:hypothetical protein